MELTINGEVYSFQFNIGFLRDINKTVMTPVDGVPGLKKEAGLSFAVASLIDGDVEELVTVLDLANKRQEPRVTTKLIEDYIDDESTDIDALFDTVLDFLAKSNATRKVTLQIRNAVKKEMEKQAADL